MSMVGLFWITGTAAHIGAPPNEPGPGVLLTEELPAAWAGRRDGPSADFQAGAPASRRIRCRKP
ncbi:hypothetical protein GA0115254_124872 [Streptomyces sp. Ncost-T10-10d]|nr:hypothetical protein GA0115254_124872 [Streptomyces sp. Ncost-T10-10d]